MSMQPTDFSLRKLAIETGLDYRTAAKRLKDVLPYRQVKQEGRIVRYYRLTKNVLLALAGAGGAGNGREGMAPQDRLATAKAEQVELAIQERKKELLAFEDILDMNALIANTIRARLLALPSEIAQGDPALVEARARRLIREALDELAGLDLSASRPDGSGAGDAPCPEAAAGSMPE